MQKHARMPLVFKILKFDKKQANYGEELRAQVKSKRLQYL